MILIVKGSRSRSIPLSLSLWRIHASIEVLALNEKNLPNTVNSSDHD